MKRNSALRGLAWFSVLVIASASPVGAMLQTAANYAVAVYRADKYLTQLEYVVFLATHDDNAAIAWWVVFAAITLLAIWLGRVFTCCREMSLYQATAIRCFAQVEEYLRRVRDQRHHHCTRRIPRR